MWGNYLSIPKLQRCNRCSLGMDKYFHHTLNWTCDYLFMPVLKVIYMIVRGGYVITWFYFLQNTHTKYSVGCLWAVPTGIVLWQMHEILKNSILNDNFCQYDWWNRTGMDVGNAGPTLVQVMAWYRQTTSHYLSQGWPRSMCHMVSLGPHELKFS